MEMSQTIGAIAKALSLFQAEVQQPKKDAKNPHFNSTYVPLEGIVDVITEPLKNNSLSYLQNTFTIEQDAALQTIVMHESGEWIKTDVLKLPALQKKKDGVTEFNAQGAGSSITYARRYQLAAALGIASEADDDGHGAGSNGRPEQQRQPAQNRQQGTAQTAESNGISPAQVGLCKKLVKEKHIPNEVVIDVLGTYNAERIDALNKSQGSAFIKWLQEYETAAPTPDGALPF